MRDKPGTVLNVVAAGLLLLGDLGILFSQTGFAGYVLFSLGCVLALIGAARENILDLDERFHLLAALVGLIMLGFFVFTGALMAVVVLALVLFALDFLIALLDLRKAYSEIREPGTRIAERSADEEEFRILGAEEFDFPEEQRRREAKEERAEKPRPRIKEIERELERKKYDEYQQKKMLEELDSIKDQLNSIQVIRGEGRSEAGDVAVRKKAEQIKNEIKGAVVVEDPKAGRYFYKEDGKMFHVAGCMTLQRMNKKEIKPSQSRTALLAKGYKPCKICSA
jgi:lipid-A-disaccharide synthase-like uncharacterized protein